MKLIQFLRGAALGSAASLLMLSCKKEDTSFTTPNKLDVQTPNEKSFGVMPDDPARVARVPMIISAQFLQENRLALSADPLAITGSLYTQPYASRGGSNDRTKPIVSIVSPSSGSSVSGIVNISVSATDNVAVSQVSVNVDGSLLANSSTAPYNFSWNTSGVASGTHTITATARDAAGNSSSVSTQVGINAAPSGDVTAPIVSITSPAGGSSVTAGATVSVGVSASDNVGVSSLGFTVDGTLKNTLAVAPYNFSWNTTGVASGTHTLTATAKDAAGNTSSSSVLVTVNTTIIPPTTIPASFLLNTPPVGNQGNEGSCVAFAIAYGARSIEQYYRTNATSYNFDANIFSPEYVYNQTKFSDCGSGTAFTIVLDLLQSQGVCSWQAMPYSDVNGCSMMPNTSQISNAANYKISSYVAIANKDQVAIKTMIASKHPVITNISADNSFVNAGPGFIWSTYSGSGALPHAILICGYDDTKHAYKVMNSWGTAWGDAGFSWIDYDFYIQKSSYYTYAIQ